MNKKYLKKKKEISSKCALRNKMKKFALKSNFFKKKIHKYNNSNKNNKTPFEIEFKPNMKIGGFHLKKKNRIKKIL
jgi:hypothetical protein